MNAVEIPAGQIEWDGKTVWVTSWSGATIGRFGRGGVDVHTEDGAGCLDCVSGLEPVEAWERFTVSMFEHHDVVLVPECRPGWVDGPSCRQCSVPLSSDNARVYNYRFVGACRKCENTERARRKLRARKASWCPT